MRMLGDDDFIARITDSGIPRAGWWRCGTDLDSDAIAHAGQHLPAVVPSAGGHESR